eukprot:NODE_11868_length_216_cov_17.341317_g11127_i0.p2 GENE.NODE_11868_length_216_cov_17.341317_g11127_i0~~NODE_11868_length_216_cov_17.341317_g11127_i0.p2  ORF type:complete len:51 (-),score=3.72 NODE_11868_length_216_cov_17.341317_g11127_i0:45-197(-)
MCSSVEVTQNTGAGKELFGTILDPGCSCTAVKDNLQQHATPSRPLATLVY